MSSNASPNAPIPPQVTSASLAAALAPLAVDANVLHLAGAETVTGAKTFTTPPTLGTLAGLLKATAGAPAAATPGTDYVAPGTATAFTAQQNFALANLTDGANITWNAATQQAASITLGGNRNLALPTNMVAGGTYLLLVTQGSGGQTLTFASGYRWPGGTAPTLSTGAAAVDIISFVSDGSHMFGSLQKGFA